MKSVIAGPVDWNINEKTLGLEQFMWRKRTIACCEFISSDDRSVLDVGAGAMYLKNILPDNVQYYPLDYTMRCADTIVCDLNNYEFPDLKVDVAVCAGIIGYLNDLEWFFQKLATCAKKIILSYQSKEGGYDYSLYTTNDIIDFLYKNNYVMTGWNKELSKDWPLLACFERVTPVTLNKNYFCTGCGACVNKCPKECIELVPDEQGFLKPIVNEQDCIDCGMCTDVCPATKCHEMNEEPLGGEIDCYAAWADDYTRSLSSSGGAFSVLAKSVLESGGVVFGVEYTSDFYVQHTCIDSVNRLEKIRKSKYVQSNTRDTYRQAKSKLDEGVFVLYVGTPCQIAGLKSFLGKDYDNLLAVDLICFCVTPVTAFRKYLDEKYGLGEIENVVFRDKYKGWSCGGYTIHKKDGSILYLGIDTDEYQKVFHNVLCRNKTCDDCRFAFFQRQGDVSLGDFWGIECHDTSWNDNKGTSLILANTKKGQLWIENLRGKFNRIEKVPYEWCRHKGNRICGDGRKRNPYADDFMKMISKKGFLKSVETIFEKKYDIAMVCMHNHNYGNNLTNYALYQCLSDMGLEVAVVNRSLDCEWKNIKSDMLMFGHNPYSRLDLIPDFSSRMEKKQVNKWCDMFVVASDQLFRSEFVEGMNFHTCLDWVSSDKYMFSYSTSLGKDQFGGTNALRNQMQFYLSRFNALSVREKSGVNILEEEFDLKAALVLDPVFLCDIKNYSQMAKNGKLRLPSQQYLGAYILDTSLEKEGIINNMREWGGFNEYRIISDSEISLQDSETRWNLDIMPNALVEEWLANIMYSDYFVTDSFHGVCFALIFNKDFIVITESGNWRGRARFESILSLLGLEDRIITNSSELTQELAMSHIDYQRVNSILDELKKDSLAWLSDQVKMGKKYRGKLSVYDIFDGKFDDTIRSNEELRRKYEETIQSNEELRRKYEETIQSNEGLKSYMSQLQNTNADALQKIYGLLEQEQDLHKVLLDKKMIMQENEQLHMQIAQIYDSTSWKITKGLRWIKRLFSR